MRWLRKLECEMLPSNVAAETTGSLQFLQLYRHLLNIVDVQQEAQRRGENKVHRPRVDHGELSTDTQTVTFETLEKERALIFTASADISEERYPLQYLFRRFDCKENLKRQGAKPGQVAVLTVHPSEGDITLLVPIVKKRHRNPMRPHTWLNCVLELRYWIERLALKSVYFIVLTENMDDYTEPDAWHVLIEALKDIDVRVKMASIMANAE